LYPLYKKLYFGLGQAAASPISAGDVLPTLRLVAAQVLGS
jgi:hypothetical protein